MNGRWPLENQVWCLIDAVNSKKGSLLGIVVNVLDCNIAVSKFKLQSSYYAYFQRNNLGKGINFLILPAMG